MITAYSEEPKFNEIVKFVRSFERDAYDYLPVKLGILRNITLDTTVTYLKFYCYKYEINADIYMGEYDNVLQDVMDLNSQLYRFSPDIIIVAIKKEVFCPKLVSSFSKLSRKEIDKERIRVLEYFETVIKSIRKNSDAAVLVHNFDIPVFPSFGILDYQENDSQINTFRRINAELIRLIRKYESVYVVDIDLLQSLIGHYQFFDNRHWHLGKAPYTRLGSKIIAQEYMKIIRALKGKNKKCLVLDCDNTLWGGVVGENGFDNIKIGKNYPGSAFLEFQAEVLNLYQRGVMLAICSKNNEQDVIDVLERHPYMILRKKNFVSIKTNWKDKVSNLKQISKELNIGLESFVFVDDNKFEVNMVRQLLPEVECILLPPDPSKYSETLRSEGFFDSLTFSDEDSKRSEMYLAEAKRKKAASLRSNSSIDDYFKYLEMEVLIKMADDFAIPRISQLTQRTNQFNLTTKRYSENEIKEFANSKSADVRYLSLKDRFGDTGIVGVAILRYYNKDCHIDTFLLSCRVLGRGIEEVFLKDCENIARKRKCFNLVGFYQRTAKNMQVEAFYTNRKFKGNITSEGKGKYVYSLDNYLDCPEYFKSINSDI